jgi:hypothetical protein
MKKLITIAAIIASVLAGEAQTNAPLPSVSATNIPTQESFVSTVEGYFTSFNPANTNAVDQKYKMWTGVEWQSGIRLGADLGIEARPFSGKASGLTLGEVSTFADTVGVLAQEEIDLGWSINYIDTEITAGGCGVDTFDDGYGTGKGGNGGVFIEFKKALSQNTFSGLRATELFAGHMGNKPLVVIFAGFSF